MRTCASCGRAYAEILGAPEQRCPHCGLVVETLARAPAHVLAPGRADPVAAASLAVRTFVRGYGALSVLWIPAFLAYLAWVLVVAKLGASLPESGPVDPGEAMRFLGITLPLFVLSLLVTLASWGAVAAWLARREGAAREKPQLARLVGSGAVLAPTFVLSPLLVFAPFHWFLFVPAAIAEGQPLSAAFASSRAFSRERRTYGFTALVLLVWIVATLATAYVLGPTLGRGLRAAGIPAAYAEASGEALASWALGPLVPLFPAAYWILAKRDEREAPPVAGDASAAERWATTKCPGCSTLIPYARTGAPVHVSCPVCGREGDVV